MHMAKQTWFLLQHSLKMDWASKERWVSPLLFSLLLLTIFSFTAGEIPSSYAQQLLVSQTFLVLVFALQNAFSRILDPEQKDQVADLLQTYPLSMTAWYVAKFLLACFHGLWILAPSLLVASLFHGAQGGPPAFYFGFFGILCLCLLGLSALGTLATAMTLRAKGKDLLQPLLYFTLAVPILLAGSQASLALVQGRPLEDFSHWIYLLLGFDVICLTMGILFFETVVSDLS